MYAHTSYSSSALLHAQRKVQYQRLFPFLHSVQWGPIKRHVRDGMIRWRARARARASLLARRGWTRAHTASSETGINSYFIGFVERLIRPRARSRPPESRAVSRRDAAAGTKPTRADVFQGARERADDLGITFELRAADDVNYQRDESSLVFATFLTARAQTRVCTYLRAGRFLLSRARALHFPLCPGAAACSACTRAKKKRPARSAHLSLDSRESHARIMNDGNYAARGPRICGKGSLDSLLRSLFLAPFTGSARARFFWNFRMFV